MNPSVDATDLYMFRSYEAGRAGFVTILERDVVGQDKSTMTNGPMRCNDCICTYLEEMDPQGGPHFFQFNPNAFYEIQIDNAGAGSEALTF